MTMLAMMLSRIRLTLKQHRFETIAFVILCLGLAAASLIEAYRLGAVQFPAGCVGEGVSAGVGGYPNPYDPSRPPTPCDLATQRFNDIAWGFDMNLVRMFEMIVPFIVGIVFGAVLVAREIEQGTAPLSWALAGSRTRWLLGKLLAVVVLIVPLLLIAGLAADVRQGALVPGGSDSHASFQFYADRGVFFVFWGLAALCGTVALGTLMGRTLPAVLVALVVCVFARGLWEQTWNHTVLRQFAVMVDGGYNYAGTDLWVYQSDQLYLDGKPWYGDINAWWQANETCVDYTPDPSMAGGAGGKPVGGTICGPFDQIDPNKQPLMAPEPATYVIHGDRYWGVVALESAALLAGSVVFAAVALFWVNRRRPY
jgi:hypothetical protein